MLLMGRHCQLTPCAWDNHGGVVSLRRLADGRVLRLADVVRVEVRVRREVLLWRATSAVPCHLVFDSEALAERFWGAHVAAVAAAAAPSSSSSSSSSSALFADPDSDVVAVAAAALARLLLDCRMGRVTDDEYGARFARTRYHCVLADVLRGAVDSVATHWVRSVLQSPHARTLRWLRAACESRSVACNICHASRLVVLGSDERECARVFAAAPVVAHRWLLLDAVNQLMRWHPTRFAYGRDALLCVARGLGDGIGDGNDKDDEDECLDANTDPLVLDDLHVWQLDFWREFYFDDSSDLPWRAVDAVAVAAADPFRVKGEDSGGATAPQVVVERLQSALGSVFRAASSSSASSAEGCGGNSEFRVKGEDSGGATAPQVVVERLQSALGSAFRAASSSPESGSGGELFRVKGSSVAKKAPPAATATVEEALRQSLAERGSLVDAVHSESATMESSSRAMLADIRRLHSSSSSSSSSSNSNSKK